MNRLKFGALLTGFIFLSSCTGDSTVISVIGNNATIESQGITLAKSIIKNYISISQNNQVDGLTKRSVHPNHFITALPISFGTADAILISN